MASEVAQYMANWKALLDHADAQTMQTMAERYVSVQDALKGAIEHCVSDITAVTERGEQPTLGLLHSLETYQHFQKQAAEQYDQYSAWAEDVIKGTSQAAAKAGAESAAESIAKSPTAPVGQAAITHAVVDAVQSFDPEATDAMAGMTAGGPLQALLQQGYGQMEQMVGQKLINGVALGKNAMEVAAEASDSLGIGLDRITTIARTEMSRAFNQSTVDSYRASEIVTQYVRMSARDDLVCEDCLCADGDVYDTEDDPDDHPNCRCCMAPLLEGQTPEDLGLTDSRSWFDQQTPDIQQSIMGPGRLGLYQDAKAESDDAAKSLWDRIPSRKVDETWGPTLRPTTIEDLKSGLGGLASGGMATPASALADHLLMPYSSVAVPGAEKVAVKVAAGDLGKFVAEDKAAQSFVADVKAAQKGEVIKAAEAKAPKITAGEIAKQTVQKAEDAAKASQSAGTTLAKIGQDPLAAHAWSSVQVFADQFHSEGDVAKYLNEQVTISKSGAELVLQAWRDSEAGVEASYGGVEAAASNIMSGVERGLPQGEDLAGFTTGKWGTESELYAGINKWTDEYQAGLPGFDRASEAKALVTRDLNSSLWKNDDWRAYVEEKISGAGFVIESGPTREAAIERISEKTASDRIKMWATTSADTFPEAVATQMTAQQLFGLADATLEHVDADTLRLANKFMEDKVWANGTAAFLQAQYESTQAWYAERDITEVTSFRGMHWDTYRGEVIPENLLDRSNHMLEYETSHFDLVAQPLSSWSTAIDDAASFALGGNASALAAAKIPVERIFSNCRTGFGCLRENEITVLGGADKVHAFIGTPGTWEDENAKLVEDVIGGLTGQGTPWLDIANGIEP